MKPTRTVACIHLKSVWQPVFLRSALIALLLASLATLHADSPKSDKRPPNRILRGRYRAFLLKPELMQPGQVYEITIDLGPVAATIAKGHELRVDVSGADSPLYDRNPDTADGITSSQAAIGTEKLHHKKGEISRIVLPTR